MKAPTGPFAAPRFLTWCLVAFTLSFGLVWLYVAAMPMAFLSRDYPLWIAKRTMLDECRLGDVAVFGDSRTLAGTEPSVMPVPVMNSEVGTWSWAFTVVVAKFGVKAL